ncbi:XRE family transcriptional regulator [Streptomyces sp. B6B3]|uniref:XRE family transcriptional regulator n=1 Tax=Streptomyces sp. B6B3 TaxID=3153570 RepID=UPI00325EE09B
MDPPVTHPLRRLREERDWAQEQLVAPKRWLHWLPGADKPLPIGLGSAHVAVREALTMTLDRRAFAGYASTALVALAQSWATLEPTRLTASLDEKRVDPELLDWLEVTADRLTTQSATQRQHTAGLIDAHLTAVDGLLHGNCGDTTRVRLHVLLARLATAAGWYRFDQGAHAAASRYWHAALHSAHQAGDRDLGAGILGDLGYQQVWLQRPDAAVRILTVAVSRATHPAARALLVLRRARAHALLGDAGPSRRDLAAAEVELGAAARSTRPAWCAWLSEADLAVDSGRCLLDLGDTAQAHALINEGVEELPLTRAKTRAVFLGYAAESRLRSGDVEHAAVLARDSFALAARLGAARCLAQIQGLAPAFRPHRTTNGVAELLDLVSTSSATRPRHNRQRADASAARPPCPGTAP